LVPLTLSVLNIRLEIRLLLFLPTPFAAIYNSAMG